MKKIILGLLLTTGLASAQTSIIRQDNVKIGRGTSSDKSIVLDKGSGAANPAIKWNNTSGALQFTNDGTNYLDFGSGSGGSGGYSVLVNGDFETGISTGWTYSGSTVTVATSGSNLLIGGKSAVFDATANNEYIQSTAYTLPNGLYGRNCYAQILYKGGDTNLSLQVLDGSSNVLGSTALVAATNPTKAYFNFICPTSGSVQLKVKASADAAAIALDSMFLGEAINIANISQAQAIVHADKVGSQNIASSTATTITGWASTFDTYSEFNTTTGVFTAKSSKRLVFSARADVGNQSSSEVYSIGIKKNGAVATCDERNPTSATLTSNTGMHLTPCIIDAVAGDTFVLYVDSSADTSYDVAAGTTTQIDIMQFPATQEMAIRPDLQFWKVDANISGANPSLGTASQSAYVEIANGSLALTNNSGQGNIAAQIPCTSTVAPSGLNCGGNNESVGVAFTPTGTFPQDVLACVSFGHSVNIGASGVVDGAFQVVETPINAQTISQEGKSRVPFSYNQSGNIGGYPLRVCGTFTFTSGGQKALRLAYEQSITATVTTNVIVADASTSVGQRDIHWEVYPINQGIPAPILVGSVNSNSSGMERIERADVTCSGSSAINSQSGSWLSSIGNVSSGFCAVTIAAGIFSAAPVCMATPRDNSSTSIINAKIHTMTSTTFSLGATVANSGSSTITGLSSSPFHLICMGPR